MTAVKGHLTAVEFPPDYKKWEYPPPERLFDAPVLTVVPDVRETSCLLSGVMLTLTRTTNPSPKTSKTRLGAPPPSLYGQIAIARASTSAARSAMPPGRATPSCRSSGLGSATSRERKPPPSNSVTRHHAEHLPPDTFYQPPADWLPSTRSKSTPSTRASSSTSGSATPLPAS